MDQSKDEHMTLKEVFDPRQKARFKLNDGTKNANLVITDLHSDMKIKNPLYIGKPQELPGTTCNTDKEGIAASENLKHSMYTLAPFQSKSGVAPITVPRITLTGKTYTNIKIVKLAKTIGNVKFVRLASLDNTKIVNMPKSTENIKTVDSSNIVSTWNMVKNSENAKDVATSAINKTENVSGTQITNIINIPDLPAIVESASIDDMSEFIGNITAADIIPDRDDVLDTTEVVDTAEIVNMCRNEDPDVTGDVMFDANGGLDVADDVETAETIDMSKNEDTISVTDLYRNDNNYVINRTYKKKNKFAKTKYRDEIINASLNDDETDEEMIDQEFNSRETSPVNTLQPKILPASYLCKNCRFEFHMKPFFNLHFSACNELRCFRCQSQFETLQDSYIHQQSCAKYYACKGCKKDFNTAKRYQSHLKRCKKHSRISFSCKRCRDFTTSDAVSYENHMRKCDSFKFVDVCMPQSQTFECEVCNLVCQDSVEYDRHTDKCGVYKCACRADFLTLPALIDHSRTCRFTSLKGRRSTKRSHIKQELSSEFIKHESYSDDDFTDEIDEIDEIMRTFECNAKQAAQTIDERTYEVTSNGFQYKSCLDMYENDIDNLFKTLQNSEFRVKADLQCAVCKRFTASAELLQTHLTLQHNMTNIFYHYLCGYCNRVAYRISNFSKHSYQYHVARSCKICYAQYNSLKELQQHITMEHLEGGSKDLCTVCSQVFAKEEIASHRQWHAMEEEKQCEECGKVLIGVRKYAMHMSAHRCNGKILCPLCGRMVFRYMYNWHQKKKHSSDSLEPGNKRRKNVSSKDHGQDRKVRKVTTRIEPDDRKRSRQGNILPPKKHLCVECDKYFDATTFKKHERAHALGHVRAHQCQYCRVSFRRPLGLQQHVRACHALERPHCAPCDLAFASLQLLYEHRRTTHQRLKPTFLCCATSFDRFSQVEQHFIDFHTDGKCTVTKLLGGNLSAFVYNLIVAKEEDGKKHIRVLCGHCGKLFKTITRTNMHIEVVHIGTRKYMCSYCEMSFKNQEALTHHEYRHLDLKPYKCSVCGQCFRQGNDLKKHERRHEQTDVVERKAKKWRKFDLASESE